MPWPSKDEGSSTIVSVTLSSGSQLLADDQIPGRWRSAPGCAAECTVPTGSISSSITQRFSAVRKYR
jgi:hypothetical protein